MTRHHHTYYTEALPQRLHDLGYRTMIFGKGPRGARDTPGAEPKVFGCDLRIDAGSPEIVAAILSEYFHRQRRFKQTLTHLGSRCVFRP